MMMNTLTAIGARKSTRKVLIGVIIGVLSIAVIASIGAGLYLFDYAIARKPPLSNEIPPDANPLSAVMTRSRIDGAAWLHEHHAERLTVTAGDGTELVGYFIQATEPASDKLAVLIHGHRSNAAMMGNYGEHYRQQGYHVFMADNRGHGESGGDYVGMGWLDRLDYLVWLDLLTERLGSGTQIVLHGISMGASTALMISGEDAAPYQIAAIIADCGYSSVREEFRYQIREFFHLPAFPIFNVGSLASRILAGFSFEEASAIEQVRRSDIPTFIIHGEIDSYNPTYMAYDIYDAVGGEKELWIVPQANHGLAYYMNPEEYFTRVWAFIARKGARRQISSFRWIYRNLMAGRRSERGAYPI
jgi:fermentation-respiration switch protein FrsA (DUF1100 family)